MDETASPDDWLDDSLQTQPQQGHRQISEVEYSRLAEQFHTTGYREGIHRGKDQAIQEGFNHGFAAGAQRGKRLGVLRGRAAAALHILLQQTEEDARVDRVRKLIRCLNQYGTTPNHTSQPNTLEDLTSRMNGLMASSNPNHSQAPQELQGEQDDQLLDRCQFELGAILASMDICLPTI